MKMKNMLIGGMSLALVACLSVGATLAYFTASDQEVVNTFNFVADGDGDGEYISVTLGENNPQTAINENKTKYGDVQVVGNDQKGYDYKDVVPGQTLPKEPTVKVKTDVPAYIYLRVTDKDAEGEGNEQGMEAVITGVEASKWTKIDETTSELTGERTTVYAYNAIVEKTNSEGKDLEALFTEVKVPNVDPVVNPGDPEDPEDDTVTMPDLNGVKIEVAAIQSAGFNSASDAYENGDVAGIFTSWDKQ